MLTNALEYLLTIHFRKVLILIIQRKKEKSEASWNLEETVVTCLLVYGFEALLKCLGSWHLRRSVKWQCFGLKLLKCQKCLCTLQFATRIQFEFTNSTHGRFANTILITVSTVISECKYIIVYHKKNKKKMQIILSKSITKEPNIKDNDSLILIISNLLFMF